MTSLPHVTSILKGVGLIDTTFMTDFGRDRGTAVHEATALDDRNDLDESSVDPVIAPYLAAWRRFRAEAKLEIVAVEQHVEHTLYAYCGTLDRIVRLGGGAEWVIDIKTGAPRPTDRLQIAAYALAWKGRMSLAGSGLLRAAVYLRDDGTYRFSPHEDGSDGDAWLAMLADYNWRIKNGLHKQEVRNVV